MGRGRRGGRCRSSGGIITPASAYLWLPPVGWLREGRGQRHLAAQRSHLRLQRWAVQAEPARSRGCRDQWVAGDCRQAAILDHRRGDLHQPVVGAEWRLPAPRA
jgi:hypothetical protein